MKISMCGILHIFIIVTLYFGNSVEIISPKDKKKHDGLSVLLNVYYLIRVQFG